MFVRIQKQKNNTTIKLPDGYSKWLILMKTIFEILAEQSKGEKLNPKIDIDWGNPIGKEM